MEGNSINTYLPVKDVKEIDKLLTLLEVYKSQCKYYAVYKIANLLIPREVDKVYLAFAGEKEGLTFYHTFVVLEDKSIFNISLDMAFAIGVGIDKGMYYPCVGSGVSNPAESLKAAFLFIVEEYMPDYVEYFKGIDFVLLE